jgi:hypothetical protein
LQVFSIVLHCILSSSLPKCFCVVDLDIFLIFVLNLC